MFENCRAAAFLHSKEKELSTILQATGDQEILLERAGADRSLEENEKSYLQADLEDLSRQINQKSGSEYLKSDSRSRRSEGFDPACRTDHCAP